MANFIDKLFRNKLQHRQFSSEAGDWTAMNELLNSELGTPPLSTYSINWLFLTVASVLFSISIYAGITSSNELVENTSNSNSINLNTYNSLQKNTTSTSTQSAKSWSTYDYKKSTSSIKAVKSQQAEYQESSKAVNPLSSLTESNDELELINEDYTTRREENLFAVNSNSSNLKKSQNTAVSAVALLEKEESQNEVYKGEEQDNSSNATSFYSSDENTSKSSLSDTNNDKDKKENSYQSIPSKYGRSSFDTKALDKKEMLFLSSQSVSSLENKSSQASIKELSNDYPKIAKVKSTKAKRDFPLQLSVAAFGEVSYIMKNIKGENEFQSLIEIRNSQEKNIVSFGAGLEFQAKYKQFGFSTGITQSNWGENVQYEEKYTSEWDVTSSTINDTIWGTDIVFEYDSAWSPIDSSIVYFIVDSSFVTVIDSINISTEYDSTETITEVGLAKQNGKTQISYWEIPLYFSYQFDLGDFYLSPGIGVTIGFLKITKGYYMAEDQLSLIPINTDYSVIRKTLFNGQINLGLGYKLGDKFSIEATPVYRFNLTNIFENPGMIQKYSSLAVQFRLRYYF